MAQADGGSCSAERPVDDQGFLVDWPELRRDQGRQRSDLLELVLRYVHLVTLGARRRR